MVARAPLPENGRLARQHFIDDAGEAVLIRAPIDP